MGGAASVGGRAHTRYHAVVAGCPAFIYLTLNRTIRRRILAIFAPALAVVLPGRIVASLKLTSTANSGGAAAAAAAALRATVV